MDNDQITDKDGHEEPAHPDPPPDFCAAASPLSVIHFSSSSPFINPSAELIHNQISTAAEPCAANSAKKRKRYESSAWRSVSESPSLLLTQSLQKNPSSSSPQRPSSPSAESSEGQEKSIIRKGKTVSPVWKPHEMLCLARAWRIHYQPFSGFAENNKQNKTRAEKDKEVAEFLNKHGVNRDAKTAGTKWDNMLGEFRKVFEWEKGPNRDEVGKSYFRLSQYERKLHKLPASFDEDVYEELVQYMGPRQRSFHSKNLLTAKSKPSAEITKPATYISSESPVAASFGFGSIAHEKTKKSLRRIGKVQMVWEETAYLWAEEGETQRGMMRIENLNFFHANALTVLDENCTGCPLEAFESGRLKGFSAETFASGQHIKVLGRHKPEASWKAPSWGNGGLRDGSSYFLSQLRVPASKLPGLHELASFLHEPPARDLRFPVRQDVFDDLPSGKETFFCASSDRDCRTILYETVGPLLKPPATTTSSAWHANGIQNFIRLWDDCINNIIAKFCAADMLFLRKNYPTPSKQEQWPHLSGFLNNLCLFRAEETHKTKQEYDPSVTIVEKTMWSYGSNVPYILGYYAVRERVTFCALSTFSSSDARILRTDLLSLDLSDPLHRLGALIPCYRIASILPLLAESCSTHKTNTFVYSDYQRIETATGKIIELMPCAVTKIYPNRRRWASVKEIHEILDNKIPHSEQIQCSAGEDLGLVFKPRGIPATPTTVEQLLEALKQVTKALVALHSLSIMHRDIRWENLMKKMDSDEWFLIDFEDAIMAPQQYPPPEVTKKRDGEDHNAPEMMVSRGVHGIKVDIWSVGHLIRTSGVKSVEILRGLERKCLEQDPERRPSAAECYHHIVQLQSSFSTYETN